LSTILGHTDSMPDDSSLSPRADFPATEGGLEFIMEQIARLPTRWELPNIPSCFLCVGAVLGIVATEAFWRYVPACGS